LSSAKTPVPRRPPWLDEFKRKTAIIDIIALAFDGGCDCPACQALRDTSADLGELFLPKEARKGKVVKAP
jgi:hypothetical protein